MSKGAFYVKRVSVSTKGGYLIERGSKLKSYPTRGLRRDITEFSLQSRAKLAWVASQASEQWLAMVTLTYGAFFPLSGKDVKRDLNRFLTLLRKKVSGIKYLWFLEFQKRLAPHIHILLNIPYIKSLSEIIMASWVDSCMAYVPKYAIKSQKYKLAWFNSDKRPVKHGGIAVYQNAKIDGGLSRYAVKYSLKMEQKHCPKNYIDVGRFWGCSSKLVKTKVLGRDIGGYADLQSLVGQIVESKGIGDKYANFALWCKFIY